MLWGADGIKQHAKNLSKKAVDAHCKGTHTHNYALTCNFDAKSLYLAANVPGGSSIDTTENIHFTQQSDENDWNFIDLNPDKTNT